MSEEVQTERGKIVDWRAVPDKNPYSPLIKDFGDSKKADYYYDSPWHSEEENKIFREFYRLDHMSHQINTRLETDSGYVPTPNELKLAIVLGQLSDFSFSNDDMVDEARKVVDVFQNEMDVSEAGRKVDRVPPSQEQRLKMYEEYEHMVDGLQLEDSQFYYSVIKRAEGIKRMGAKDRGEVALFMAKHLRDFEEGLSWEAEGYYAETMLGVLNPEGEYARRVSQEVVNYVSGLAKDRVPNRPRYERNMYLLDELISWDHERFLLRTLATSARNDNLNVFFGELLADHGLSKILNTVYEEMQKPDSENLYPVLEYLMGSPQNSPEFQGKGGTKRVQVHKGIAEFYKSLNFVNAEQKPDEGAEFQGYPISEKAKGPRPDFYRNIFLRHQIKPGDKVVDLACGEGWLAGALAGMGYDAEGVDIDPKAVASASKRFPEAEFRQGDLEKLDELYLSNSVAAVTLEGGTGRHIQHWQPFLERVNKVLVDGGVFVFDLPNPQMGNQAQRLNEYRNALEKFGYSREWLARYMWRMVGSPPGQKGEAEHFIDSVILPPAWVQDYLEMSGLKLVEQHQEDNYDSRGSQKVTYIAKKVTGEEVEQMKKQAQKRFQARLDSQPRNPNLSYVGFNTY